MRRALALALLLAPAAQAQQGAEPLSAIDWLSQSVRETPVPKPARPRRAEPPVAGQVVTHDIQVMPLDAPGPRQIGTRLPSDLGLPDDLWQGSAPERLLSVIQAAPRSPLPALQDLMRKLLTLRAAPPAGLDDASFALARMDRLLEIGALDDARQMTEAAGLSAPAMFRRYFDISLLTGHEEDACRIMGQTPAAAPTFAARIFCLAQGGDWPAAALTFGTARALGDLPPLDEALLAHYLDPDLYEGEPVPPQDGPPSPLHYRLREAIGAPLPRTGLPRAYLHADLRHHIGWKSQLEAAERLTASGVLSPGILMQIYAHGRPSASGGVWDRVAAVQALEAGLQEGDESAIAAALPAAWQAAETAKIETAMAALWGARLSGHDLNGASGRLAERILLLSPLYKSRIGAKDDLVDVARAAHPQMRHIAPFQEAIRAAFAELPEPSAEGNSSPGEALLRSVALLEAGRGGDPVALREALQALRRAGLEELAQRAALQLLLLERPS